MTTAAERSTSVQQRAATNKHLTVIFKGSNRCNGRCRFCSVGDSGASMITWEDFRHVASEIEQLFDHIGIEQLEFTFHGGEPTLLGHDFIERACKQISHISSKTSFSMQSNLLSWNDELKAVVQRYAIRVGTSIDPLGNTRLDENGAAAYPRWLENYMSVTREGQCPGAIFVVSREALGQAERVYHTAEGLSAAIGQRFGLQINPIYEQGKARQTDELIISAEEFGNFLIDIWRAWEDADRSVMLTPIHHFAGHFDEPFDKAPKLSCSFSGECSQSHIGIDFDLNVAGCGRRLDSGAFIGNLRDISLVNLWENSDERKNVSHRSERLRLGACADCRFFPICHGGCPDDAELDSGKVADRFKWCKSYTMLFEAMENLSARRLRVKDLQQPQTQQQPKGVIQPVVGVEEASAAIAANLATDIWLLPSDDARTLKFDSGLGTLADGEKPRILLIVSNAHARYLPLWEGLLARPSVKVALFESDGLEPALEILNSLQASVILDLVSIAESGVPVEALERIVERFAFDQDWKAIVFPFSQILLNTLHNRERAYTNRWGMVPGRFGLLATQFDGLTGAAARIAQSLLKESQAGFEEWLNMRQPCLDCPLCVQCRGCLAPGNGEACLPEYQQLAGRVVEIAKELKSRIAPE